MTNKHILKNYYDAIEFLDYTAICLESGHNIQQSFLMSSANLPSGIFQNNCFEVIKFYELGHSFGHSLHLAGTLPLSAVAQNVFENLSISLKFGTKISKVLTQLSAQLRLNMASKLEELAYEAPIKMIFPLVIFIFPVIFMLFGTKTFLNFVLSLGA